jgi:hypothetical protein
MDTEFDELALLGNTVEEDSSLHRFYEKLSELSSTWIKLED